MARKRRNRKSRRPRRTAARPTNAAKLDRVDRFDGPVLELVEYEITTDPLEDPDARCLSRRERERIDKVVEAFCESPGECVEELEQLVREFPDIPRLYNFLGVAYEEAGLYERLEELIRETYRRFPNYLFGLVAYAQLCIRDGRADEVPGILRHSLALHHLYPDRRRFHLSEFVAFTALLAEYFLEVGKAQAAVAYSAALQEVAPDHPLTQRIRSIIRRHTLRRWLRGGFRSHGAGRLEP